MTWSHFRVLVPLKTRGEREFYARAASETGWNVRELREQIGKQLFARAREQGSEVYREPDGVPISPLRPAFGQLYTYRLKRQAGLPFVGDQLVVDLGFGQVYAEGLEGLEKPSADMVVTSVKTNRKGEKYRFLPNRDRGRKLYTYVAGVAHIVDGDTLDACCDCGFNRPITTRLRRRGIDCPELYSEAGQKAKQFVTERLADLLFIIIGTTRRRDIYGRYLADIRYLPGATDPQQVLKEGIYLNRQLLDEGLARPYR